jgi:VanZ family protein
MSMTAVLIYRSLLALIAVLIVHLATTAHAYPVVSSINDKANHLVAFVALALLHDHAFPRHSRLGKTTALLGYGVAIEAVQWLLPYRDASALDLVADAAGIGAYWMVSSALSAVRRQRAAA